MIQLTNRTEYSFRVAAGKLDDVLGASPEKVSGICDRHGTWGHVPFAKACKAKGIKPIFGVELACVADASVREKGHTNYIRLIAKDREGLRFIYETVHRATEHFYYVPRIDYAMLREAPEGVAILLGPFPDWERVGGLSRRSGVYLDLNQLSAPLHIREARKRGVPLVANSDNLYPTPGHRDQYQMVMGMFAESRTSPSHILSRWELAGMWPEYADLAIENAEALADECEVELKKATMVIPPKPKTLRQMCLDGAEYRKLDLSDPIYEARLERELGLIDEKNFEDYFYVVADLVQYAKRHMLVGPARGSSCGSLVCYLIGITDIDPIPFGLIFERFIDINREDYPDIDIDFADSKREMVFEYLREKYGEDCVAKLGTVSVFKAKSAITDVSKALDIPKWEVDELKNSIIERSGGDARAAFCILDTFEETDLGKRTLEAYPELAMASLIEGHARHTGIHAAGIIVTEDPIANYCSVNSENGAVQLDKKDAEALDLLKIDVLGLRTLSVIQDCLDQVGMTKEDLDNWTLEDPEAFAVLNDGKFYGVFQFEGQALQTLVSQMRVDSFEDVVSVTALARPGPLASGGTSDFIKRKTGKEKVTYQSKEMEEETSLTYGVVVYQEQVMNLARNLGKLSWEDTSNLRKAMSKSLGEEFFNTFWEKFKVGALSTGMSEEVAREVWDNVNTMGSWAFNRSHAVAYGMMSYWCMVLKAHHPLEYAAACLRNSKDDAQSIRVLRELVQEGFTYKAKSEESGLEWAVNGKELIGPLQGIKGIGPKLAIDIVKRRESGTLTPRQVRLLSYGETPWDSVFPTRDLWGHIFESPGDYNIKSKLVTIDSFTEDSSGPVCFIARMTARATRDGNEEHYLKRRDGKRLTGQTKHLNITVEDDTGSIMVQFNRHCFIRRGKPLIEDCSLGDWFIFKGSNTEGIRMIWGNRWVKLSGDEKYLKKL